MPLSFWSSSFQNDYDMIDFVNELRESCLEAFTGIVQGLKGDDDKNISRTLIQIRCLHRRSFV